MSNRSGDLRDVPSEFVEVPLTVGIEQFRKVCALESDEAMLMVAEVGLELPERYRFYKHQLHVHANRPV